MSKYGHSEDAYEDADRECSRLMDLLEVAHGDLVAASAQPVIKDCPECYGVAHTGLCKRRPDNHFYPAPNFAVAGVWPAPIINEASLAAARDMYADMHGGTDD